MTGFPCAVCTCSAKSRGTRYWCAVATGQLAGSSSVWTTLAKTLSATTRHVQSCLWVQATTWLGCSGIQSIWGEGGYIFELAITTLLLKIIYNYCKKILKSDHYNYFVFGHRHLPLKINLGNNSHYYNCGDWFNHYSYLDFTDSGLTLKYFNPEI